MQLHKVYQGQAVIKNGIIVEDNSAEVDLAAFNATARITDSLDLLSDTEVVVDDLDHERFSGRFSQYLSRAKDSLEEGWDDTQTASFVLTSNMQPFPWLMWGFTQSTLASAHPGSPDLDLGAVLRHAVCLH